MSLPDAAAEFARQLVAALAGDTGRDERNAERELRELRDIVKTQHEKELLLTKQRDELLAAVREYLASPGEHPRRLLQRRYDDIVAPLP